MSTTPQKEFTFDPEDLLLVALACGYEASIQKGRESSFVVIHRGELGSVAFRPQSDPARLQHAWSILVDDTQDLEARVTMKKRWHPEYCVRIDRRVYWEKGVELCSAQHRDEGTARLMALVKLVKLTPLPRPLDYIRPEYPVGQESQITTDPNCDPSKLFPQTHQVLRETVVPSLKDMMDRIEDMEGVPPKPPEGDFSLKTATLITLPDIEGKFILVERGLYRLTPVPLGPQSFPGGMIAKGPEQP